MNERKTGRYKARKKQRNIEGKKERNRERKVSNKQRY